MSQNYHYLFFLHVFNILLRAMTAFESVVQRYRMVNLPEGY